MHHGTAPAQLLNSDLSQRSGQRDLDSQIRWQRDHEQTHWSRERRERMPRVSYELPVECDKREHERKRTLSTTDSTKHYAQPGATSFTQDPSPLEMDAETFYHLGMQASDLP
jgi:hypothetical protein